LALLGAAMIATGQAAHEIEEELIEVGERLGYPHIQVGLGVASLILWRIRHRQRCAINQLHVPPLPQPFGGYVSHKLISAVMNQFTDQLLGQSLPSATVRTSIGADGT